MMLFIQYYTFRHKGESFRPIKYLIKLIKVIYYHTTFVIIQINYIFSQENSGIAILYKGSLIANIMTPYLIGIIIHAYNTSRKEREIENLHFDVEEWMRGILEGTVEERRFHRYSTGPVPTGNGS